MRTSLLAMGPRSAPRRRHRRCPLRTGGCPARGLPFPVGPEGRSARSCARGRRRPRRHPPRRAPPTGSPPPIRGAMFLPGAEAGVVHVSEGAPRLVVGGEVLLEPPRLGRTRAAANLLAVAVEGHHVPGPELVEVVALLGVACGLTEVLEVASGPFGEVLVVTGDRPGALLEPSPRRPVAFLEVRRRASGVRRIAQGQDRPIDV